MVNIFLYFLPFIMNTQRFKIILRARVKDSGKPLEFTRSQKEELR